MRCPLVSMISCLAIMLWKLNQQPFQLRMFEPQGRSLSYASYTILLTTMTGPKIGSSRGQIEDQFARIVNPITQLVYGLLAFNS